jgi:hypothetical protein
VPLRSKVYEAGSPWSDKDAFEVPTTTQFGKWK